MEWLVWLHAQPTIIDTTREHPRDPLIAAYFEQWVNALAYELYFPKELHAASLHFFDLTAQHPQPPLSDWQENSDRLPNIRQRFEKLYAINHPLRVALFDLASLDLVRTIEGKT